MTKGVREAVNANFAANLSKRAELGNAGFRKLVMQAAVAQFSISVASAATHYNHALKAARAADPKSVEGLGRPEGKNNGGRKPIHVVDVIKVKTGEVVASGLSKAKADLLITTASGKGKAKLAIKEVEAAAPVVAETPAAEVAATA